MIELNVIDQTPGEKTFETFFTHVATMPKMGESVWLKSGKLYNIQAVVHAGWDDEIQRTDVFLCALPEEHQS